MSRLFVAVWPPAEVVERVAALPRPDVAGLRWTRPDQWHVTLRFLGRVDDVKAVGRALGEVKLPAVEVSVGPAVGSFGRRVLHVPVTGLHDVAIAVVGATKSIGEPPEDRTFSGHLTLARVAKGAYVDLRTLVGAPISGTWRVEEFTLVDSRLAASGATYQVLDRFPLSG